MFCGPLVTSIIEVQVIFADVGIAWIQIPYNNSSAGNMDDWKRAIMPLMSQNITVETKGW